VTTVRRTEARVAPLPDRPVSDSSSVGHCTPGETLRSTTWSGPGAKEAWWCTRTVALAGALAARTTGSPRGTGSAPCGTTVAPRPRTPLARGAHRAVGRTRPWGGGGGRRRVSARSPCAAKRWLASPEKEASSPSTKNRYYTRGRLPASTASHMSSAAALPTTCRGQTPRRPSCRSARRDSASYSSRSLCGSLGTLVLRLLHTTCYLRSFLSVTG
jgi:hypothetical protein